MIRFPDEPDGDRRTPLASELREVDLGAREECEQNTGERPDEREPTRHVEVERIGDDETGEELDQRYRDSELHRDHRREQDRCGEDRCNRDVAHLYLPSSQLS
jgi:hypothetical protein